MDEIIVTWEAVLAYIDTLVMKVQVAGIKVSGVYGIPRGGLVLAVMISHRLNVPLLLAPAPDCIVVDDIVDSGRTLLHYTTNDTQFNKYYLTTMYCCDRSIVKPDFYMYDKKDKWIRFPWEV